MSEHTPPPHAPGAAPEDTPAVASSHAPGGSTRYDITVPASASRMRIDRFLADALPDLSRARVQALVSAGAAELAEGADSAFHPVTSTAHKLRPGERVRLTVPPAAPAEPAPEAIALDILYEDEQLIVINKPAGMTVHPAPGNEAGTLVNALLAHCGDSLSGIGGVRRPGIVHRLDKDTSGVMVVAKTDAAHQALAAQFAAHGADGALERAYLALAWGAPRGMRAIIDAPIGRHPGDRKKMAVTSLQAGRRAVTHVEVRRRYGPEARPLAALLECRLETGRTHQIRVHLAHKGWPVIGDPLYATGFKTRINALPEPARAAAQAMRRQALHARLLGFRHPETGKTLTFEAEPPPDMARLIAALDALPA